MASFVLGCELRKKNFTSLLALVKELINQFVGG